MAAFVAVALAASATATAGQPVDTKDMQRYCAGEAAGKFSQRPQDISTLPMERTGGAYVVYGQYPPEGQDVTTFECRFDAGRVFQQVKRTGHTGSAAATHGGGSSVPEIKMHSNGLGEVILDDGCIAYYGKNGKRFKSKSACNEQQRHQADEAMQRYRREQDL